MYVFTERADSDFFILSTSGLTVMLLTLPATGRRLRKNPLIQGCFDTRSVFDWFPVSCFGPQQMDFCLLSKRYFPDTNAVEVLLRVCAGLLDHLLCPALNFRRRGLEFLAVEHDRSNFRCHIDPFFLPLGVHPPSDPIEAGLDSDCAVLTAATRHRLSSIPPLLRLRGDNNSDNAVSTAGGNVRVDVAPPPTRSGAGAPAAEVSGVVKRVFFKVTRAGYRATSE